MIDDKKIEDVAKVYMIGEFYDRDEAEWNYPITNEEKRNQCIIDFKAGAKWMQEEFLKDLWHPADEMPNENNEVICVDKDSQTITYNGIVNWWAFCRTHDVTHWLYVDDLLPKEGGEQ